jgi:hypothetical protein
MFFSLLQNLCAKRQENCCPKKCGVHQWCTDSVNQGLLAGAQVHLTDDDPGKKEPNGLVEEKKSLPAIGSPF